MKKTYILKNHIVKMKPIKVLGIILFLSFIFQLNSISALSDLGTFKQNDCVNLYQQCQNCTYVNLTTVKYPQNSTIISYNQEMTKNGVDYNYSFCGTDKIGIYSYTVLGDKDGTAQTETINFEITPSGLANNPTFYIVIIAISLLAIAFGFYIEDNWVIVLGSFGLYFIGLYTIFFGFAGIKDQTYTIGISTIILALAAYFSIRGSYEALFA